MQGVLLPPHGIHAADCAGEVLLEDVYYFGDGFGNSVMQFERCAKVTMRGCEIMLSGEPVTLVDTSILLSAEYP